MKTKVENISDVKVRLTITLEKAELEAAEQVALTKLAKDIKVSGFRKGKAPLDVVAQNVDPVALGQETMENAISKGVAEAFMGEKIKALNRPEVEIIKFVPAEILEFTAESEILPVVKLGNYKKLKAKKEKVEVSAEEINETIEKIRANFAEKKSVERDAKNGDEVVIDFVGKKDGVAFDGGTAEKFPLELGSKSFIPGFEEGLVGVKVGDELSLDLGFPKDYHAKDLAGEKVVFEVKVHEINEKVLPELDDKFATKLGDFKTFADFKKQIEDDLKERKDYEASENFRDALVKELAEISEVPVPEILLNDQKSRIEFDMQQNLMYSGLTLDGYLEKLGKTHEQWIKEDVEKVAEERVKSGLALAELSKVEKIEATNEELEARINALKAQYANNKDAVKQLSTPQVKQEIAGQILTEKAVELLEELNSK